MFALMNKSRSSQDYIKLGDLARETGSPRDAARAYHEAILRSPDRTDIRLLYADMLKESGQLAKALAEYRRAFSEQPDNLDINTKAEYILAQLGRTNEDSRPQKLLISSEATQTGAIQPPLTSEKMASIIERIEASSGRAFSREGLGNRNFHPFDPINTGEMFDQIFIPNVPIIESLTFFFFTFCKPNGASINIKLFEVTNLELDETLLLDHYPEIEDIKDGKAYPVWLNETIPGADRRIFRLQVSLQHLDQGSMFSAPAIVPEYKVICLTPKHPVLMDYGLALEFNTAPMRDAYKTFAFIGGCPGDAPRWRCEHQAEILQRLGYSIDVFRPWDIPYKQLLANYSIIIAHRVPHDPEFEEFIKEAETRNIIVVYETDDLIFDPSKINQIDAYKYLPAQEQDQYLDGVNRYRKAMSLCRYVSVSTEKLAEEVNINWPDKYVGIFRNIVSEEMYQLSLLAKRAAKTNTDVVRIAYFSGTKTHAKDFAECVPTLCTLLERHSNVRLLIVGNLDVPVELERYDSQIETQPFIPWREMPQLYRQVDINLAPLETNDFTASKSEVKYLDAGLVGVPTVASDVGAFKQMIRHDGNGVLCRSEEDWTSALESLIHDRSTRERIGSAAFNDIAVKSTTYGATNRWFQQWREMANRWSIGNHRKQLSSIAFVIRAPIAMTGGGYKKIFLLANYLHARGYDVRVHVEQIAHLEGKDEAYIKDFCATYFDAPPEIIRVGHHRIGPVDVAIATNWPTAPTVAQMHNACLKMYFVQDFEPSFYEVSEENYRAAEDTYTLPLAFVTIGKYLASRLSDRGQFTRHIPFSVSETFHQAGRDRQNGRQRTSQTSSILFFARPNIPRRNFDAGVKALSLIHEKYGENVSILLYGLDDHMTLPFPYKNLGHITSQDLADYMASSDIHLSYSMTNISTVIYEAMACGCACVEADTDSVRPMVRDGFDCVLATPTGEGTFQALDELLGDETRRLYIADNGYNFARSLTEDQMQAEFESHIKESWLG